MILIDTIEKEISELETRDASYATVERLAWLYIVRDHLTPANSPQTVGLSDQSEFLKVVSGKPVDHVMSVMDGLMSELSVVCPREYQSILSRIKNE